MEAIVLARRDFREFDQIISLYTRERGKVQLLARGVKKILSKNSVHLEPGSYILAEHAAGREMGYLTTAQTILSFSGIWQDTEKLVAVRFAMFCVERMTEVGERDERMFLLLLGWLRHADRMFPWRDILLDGCIVGILSALGFAPQLALCVACKKPFREIAAEDSEGGKPGMHFAAGGIVCAACRRAKASIAEEMRDCTLKDIINLSVLLKSDWRFIEHYSAQEQEAQALHRLVYAFTAYHTEKRLADWRETASDCVNCG